MAKGTIGVHARGRPTKYGPDILKITRKYIDECVDSYERVLKSKSTRSVMYEHKFRVRLPTLEGLSVRLGVHKDTITEWQKQHDDFSVLIRELLGIQAERLVNNGLTGDYNPTIAKVLLTKHGYREGMEHANPDGTNLFRPDDKDRDAADRALKDL